MVDNLLRLQTIVGKQLRINPNRIKPSAHFSKELGADSLDIVELVMAIEDQAASQIETVQGALNYIQGRWTKT